MSNNFELLNKLKGKREMILMWLKKNHKNIFVTNKHLKDGTEARAYWYYGYLLALTDSIKNLEANVASMEEKDKMEKNIISSPNNSNQNNWKNIFILVLIVLLISSVGYGIFQHREKETADARLMELINESTRLHTEVEETKNKYSDAVSAIKDLSDENTQLVDLVADLRVRADKPPIIKEIIVTKTVVKPSEPIYITTELPQEHRFKLSPGLEVARFSQQGGKYAFETHELSIRNSVVIGENKSTSLLQIASSAEPDKYYEIPIDDFDVRIIEPARKMFKPDLMLAARIGLNENPQLTASLNLTFLHPLKCLDALGVTIAGNSQTFQAGIIPVAYNIGCHLPVFDDLWIVTDAFVDIHAKFGAGIGLGTKF
jgi:hypothetical protein